MADSLFYWDSCVFLDLIGATPGRIGNIRPYMEAAEKRTIEIVTSTFTVAEVAFAQIERDNKSLDPEVEKEIDSLWGPNGGPIRLVEFSLLTAERARTIMRQAVTNGWTGLKAKDAVHLATAQPLGVDAVHTYDDKWPRHGADLGLKIEEPQPPQAALL